MLAQMRLQSNSDEQGYTDKKKPRGTKLHLLVHHTQNKQVIVFRTYRPSCCCGSPCHVRQWCPWMKRGRGPFRLSHSLWAQCLAGTRRPHLKGGKRLNSTSEHLDSTTCFLKGIHHKVNMDSFRGRLWQVANTTFWRPCHFPVCLWNCAKTVHGNQKRHYTPFKTACLWLEEEYSTGKEVACT